MLNFIAWACPALNVGFAVLVLLDNHKRNINRRLAALCLLFALASFSTAVAVYFQETSPWSQLAALSILWSFPVFYHLFIRDLGHSFYAGLADSLVLQRKFIILNFTFVAGWTILFLHQQFTPAASPDVHYAFTHIFGTAGGMAAVGTLLGLYAYIKNYRSIREAQQKKRARLSGACFLAMGTAVSILLSWHASVPTPGWTTTALYVVATASLITMGIVVMAPQPHQLVEIQKQLTVNICLAGFLYLALAFPSWLGAVASIFQPKTVQNIFSFTLCLFIALAFKEIKFRLEEAFNQFFVKRGHQQGTSLKEGGEHLFLSSDQSNLFERLFHELDKAQFRTAALFLNESSQRDRFSLVASADREQGSSVPFFMADHLIPQYLREEKKRIIALDLNKRIRLDWERSSLRDEFSVIQADIVLPLFSLRDHNLIGFLGLGNSVVGHHSYIGRNIFWLETLVHNLAVMIEVFRTIEYSQQIERFASKVWITELHKDKNRARKYLEPQNAWVAILLVDIRGFTRLTTEQGPNEILTLLKEFRCSIEPVIYEKAGIIDKYIGDLAMVLFGTPLVPLNNPDEQAVQCAGSIQNAISELNKTRLTQGKDPIHVGISIASGNLIIGSISSYDRDEYTVVGNPANLAAKIEAVTKAGEILISEDTYKRVHSRVKCVKVNREVPGFDMPGTIYQVVGFEEKRKAA